MKSDEGQNTGQSRQYKNNHSQYFASLQNKLLEESDKLTNFMGKSLITQRSLKQLKYNLSTATLNSDHCKDSTRLSTRKQTHRKNDNYIEKAKELVQLMKTNHSMKDTSIKSPKQSTKDKYQQLRKVVYSVCKHNKHQNSKEKIQDTEPCKEELHKTKKFKTANDTNSINLLKQTISTQSGKSLQFLSEQISTLLPNQKIKLDDFVPIKLLGQGKMGQVCLVKHKKTGFMCALKQIPQHQISKDPKIILQIIREIKIQSFLDHPNIVQLYSVFVQDNNLYLLMQLCAQGDLYQHLKSQGNFTQEKIRIIIKQICHAIQYMHDNDIIHRDLKPQNILFHEVKIQQ